MICYKNIIGAIGYPVRLRTLRGRAKEIASEERKIVNDKSSNNRYPETDKISAVVEYTSGNGEKTVDGLRFHSVH